MESKILFNLKDVLKFYFYSTLFISVYWGQSTPMGCGFDSHLNDIFNIFISSLWKRGKARSWVPPLNMQWLQNSGENGEWKCEIRTECFNSKLPGSLYQTCYMRDCANIKSKSNLYSKFFLLVCIVFFFRVDNILRVSSIVRDIVKWLLLNWIWVRICWRKIYIFFFCS